MNQTTTPPTQGSSDNNRGFDDKEGTEFDNPFDTLIQKLMDLKKKGNVQPSDIDDLLKSVQDIKGQVDTEEISEGAEESAEPESSGPTQGLASKIGGK